MQKIQKHVDEPMPFPCDGRVLLLYTQAFPFNGRVWFVAENSIMCIFIHYLILSGILWNLLEFTGNRSTLLFHTARRSVTTERHCARNNRRMDTMYRSIPPTQVWDAKAPCLCIGITSIHLSIKAKLIITAEVGSNRKSHSSLNNVRAEI